MPAAAGALGFVGVTGLAGGIEMILYPRGNQFVDSDWLEGIPLVDTYRLPGLVLAGVIGGGATAAYLGLLRRPHVELLAPIEQRTGQHWSWAATRLTGGALSAWLLTELLLIHERSAVEGVYATAALALLGLPACPASATTPLGLSPCRDDPRFTKSAPPSGPSGAAGLGSIVPASPLTRPDQPPWQTPGLARMQGSVRQRCGCRDPDTGRQLGVFCPQLANPAHGSWSIDVTVPGAFGVGPPVRVRRGGYPNRQAAQAALDAVIGRSHGAGAAWTVQRWLAHWLNTNPRIRPATRASYEAHVRVHLGPTLGRCRLDELTPPMVQAAFTRIAATRTRTGQPLSPATVRRVHATLRAALNAALRDGLITTNPAWHTRLPLAQPVHPEVWTPGRVAIWQATGERPTVAVWTPDQLATFLDHRLQAHDPLYPAWHLIALRGLRRGEACGLRWADLDLDPETADEQPSEQRPGGHGRLRVVQAIVQIGGHVSPAPPKTPASRRTISLDPATTTLLRDMRTAAATRAGGRLDPTSPVLVDQAGRPIRPQRLSVAFRRAVQASGLPPVRLHDLRHGAASLALAAGADLKTVQDLLGHSTIITTADIYTSVLPEVHDRYADAVADLVQAAQNRHPHPQY